MRDNPKGMPEFTDAFEMGSNYFAVIEITIDDVSKRFQFGVLRSAYLSLKKVLQLRPFDMMPGIKYRYFYMGSCKSFGNKQYIMTVRVEQNLDATSEQIEIPQELHANLLWFDRLTSFDDAIYLEQKIDK